jgi:transcription elongation factor Elf1
MQYLKPNQYYIDLYDKFTVEKCRRLESNRTIPDVPRGKKVSKKEAEAISNWANDLMLTFEKGERWANKSRIINEWMDNDRQKDTLLESAQPPEDVRCLTCRNHLTVDSKHLWDSEDNKSDRVLFMFECPNKCLPRRAFFNDGQEWRSKPHLCVRCSSHTTTEVTDDKKKIITTYTCQSCKHVEVDEFERSIKEDDYDENFATDRDRFCLTDEEGRKFQDMKWNMERMAALGKEFDEKEKARAKQLEENPKGFHLDGSYTCSICREHTPAGDNWYDKWGIKCLVCQWAIDHHEIPASIAKNEDSWYRKYDFERYFNIRSQTLSKWVRNGLVKARAISKYGKGVHFEVYLIKDNKDFLPPKKLLESKRGKLPDQGENESRMYPWYCFGDPMEIIKDYKIANYLRIVPPEEMEAREAEKKRKWEAKQARKELRKNIKKPCKKK